jgi:hypothetical protein
MEEWFDKVSLLVSSNTVVLDIFCNTHFVNLLERIPIEKTISPYVGLTCVHHPM